MKIEQHLTVSFDFPVAFTRGLFEPENPLLAQTIGRACEPRAPRIACFVDKEVLACHPRLIGQIAGYFAARSDRMMLAGEPLPIRGGEAAKDGLKTVEALAAAMLELRLDRHSVVLAIGGGAVLDAIGLAAALAHRGLRLIRVPTTVLAQSDGGVGVKNGINFHGAKNALGTFAPPFAVLNDFDFLPTLPDREWRGGIAEAFKVAIIRDQQFFDWLCANANALRARDFETMQHLVKQCAALHIEHIRTSGDPFELGSARPLDFGHWAAHKIELLSEFRISHGEAVAAGIALDSRYAAAQGWISDDELARIERGLEESGLRLWFDEVDRPELFDGLREFREHLGGELCVTFPNGIGRRREEKEVDLDAMRRAILALRLRGAARNGGG